ncbi:DegT/DnrJ/EryC1/StrS family aminotransferase [Pseudoalteromonas issachenkonii]|uniref:DegT/DnrJ/EryC1/StrS family aminotransferase n=1 Tax=Pseudoalteromonas issachenkonii TaxID=152297 RepID=A0ABU9H3F9_9GAMM
MGLTRLQSLIATAFDRQHALLTSSGSFALITALNASQAPKGSSVIMPASCCPIVLFAIQMAGYNVILADVSLCSLSMEVTNIEAVFNDSVSVIVAVHGYGHYCKIDEIEKFAKHNNITLIEDACLAYGSKYKGKPLGSFGDFSILSFGYDKPIDNQYGGAILTNSERLFECAKEFLNENKMAQFSDVKQLEILNDRFLNLNKQMQVRKKNVDYLQNNITNSLFVKASFDVEVTYWRYPLLIKNRTHFLAKAKENGIIFTRHYKSLGELQTNGHYPNASLIDDQIINLFVRPETPQEQLTNMVMFINDYQDK